MVKARESETHSWQDVRVFKRCGCGQNCLVASYSINQVGIIACHCRAAEWRHKAVELAAHELLQLLDQTASG